MNTKNILKEPNMNYTIICGNENDLEKAEKAYISNVPWGAEYTPTSYFQGVYLKDEGFLFRLTCEEENPTATLSGNCHGVALDSCLELFLNFDPENNENYINFEMNPKAAHLFGVGKDRYGRTDLENDIMPTVKSEITKDNWSVTLFVPLAALTPVYGELHFGPGSVLKGNAFKCGGSTAPCTHYLSWAPMQKNERDFHRPDCFGSFIIK